MSAKLSREVKSWSYSELYWVKVNAREEHMAALVLAPVEAATRTTDDGKKQFQVRWDCNSKFEWIHENEILRPVGEGGRGQRQRRTPDEAARDLDRRIRREITGSQEKRKIRQQIVARFGASNSMSDMKNGHADVQTDCDVPSELKTQQEEQQNDDSSSSTTSESILSQCKARNPGATMANTTKPCHLLDDHEIFDDIGSDDRKPAAHPAPDETRLQESGCVHGKKAANKQTKPYVKRQQQHVRRRGLEQLLNSKNSPCATLQSESQSGLDAMEAIRKQAILNTVPSGSNNINGKCFSSTPALIPHKRKSFKPRKRETQSVHPKEDEDDESDEPPPPRKKQKPRPKIKSIQQGANMAIIQTKVMPQGWQPNKQQISVLPSSRTESTALLSGESREENLTEMKPDAVDQQSFQRQQEINFVPSPPPQRVQFRKRLAKKTVLGKKEWNSESKANGMQSNFPQNESGPKSKPVAAPSNSPLPAFNMAVVKKEQDRNDGKVEIQQKKSKIPSEQEIIDLCNDSEEG